MDRRTLLMFAAATALGDGQRALAAAEAPGVTKTEIKIGNTSPYSGPASAFGVVGLALSAFFRQVNDNGGVAGRKINFISLDDAYSPPKTVEQTRRLVEGDEVAFILNGIGSAPQSSVQRYMNQRKVPQLFVGAGVDKWSQPDAFPWSVGWQPTFRTEAAIYAKYIDSVRPNARVAMLHSTDDAGKDYVAGLRSVWRDGMEKKIVKMATYETSDPTVESQIVALQASGADVLVITATPKYVAQSIRKVYELNWKPLTLITNTSISVAAVINPVGPEKAVGIVSTGYLKDNADPVWNDDPGMNEWRRFMKQYMPGADLGDSNYIFAYSVAGTALHVLKQCDGDFSRENIMRQATNIRDLALPGLLPGILINTEPTNFRPVRQMQLQRWTGTRWERFGGLIEGSGI